MKKITAILLFWIFSNPLFAQQNAPFVVRENTVDVDLSGYLFTAKNLKFKDEKELISLKNQFQKSEEKVVNFGSSLEENWVMFNLKNENKNNTEFVLYLNQIFLSKADFYLFKNDTLIHKNLLSDTVKTKNRPLGEITFYYPFKALKNQNYCIFLRIKADPENGLSKCVVNLYDTKTAAQKIRNNHLEFGILIGFLLLSITIGFILFYNDSKPIYGYYSAYIFTILISYLCAYGYLTDMLDHTLVHTAKIYQSNSIIGAVLHVLFVSHFLAFDKILPTKSSKIILIICAVYVVLAISNFIFPISEILPIINRTSLILLDIFILITTFWAFYQREETAKIYLIATVPGILALLYLLLNSLKLLPLYPAVYHLLYYITIFEILVFGFGLVYQFTEEKREAERKLGEERQAVSSKIISSQERERQRISQDLHDDLGSTLSMLKFHLSESNQTLDNQLVEDIKITDKAIEDLRVIAYNLMPTMLQKNGLIVILKEFISMNKIVQKVKFTHSGNEKRLPWETELGIFRIMKELINNALKHAQATEIEVQLIYFEDFLYLSVEDNGVGFKENPAEMTGHGLKNINLRVNYLNGKMNLDSSENGTMITVEIPYDTDHQNQNLAH
jgi:signal transduction histidine kinase